MSLLVRKLHKWISLAVGLQVLLWLLSGLVMALLDPAKVSGQQWARPVGIGPEVIPPGRLLDPHELAGEYLAGALHIALIEQDGRAVYRIQYATSEALFDAVDGSSLSTSRTRAGELARRDYAGDGQIASISAGTAPDRETRAHNGAYWKVDFSDDAGTSIYVSATSGDIMERRNDYWRIHDFFWMLHIMDYTGREDFNNPLIIGVAAIALWLGVSGGFLLAVNFSRRDFRFLLTRRKQ